MVRANNVISMRDAAAHLARKKPAMAEQRSSASDPLTSFMNWREWMAQSETRLNAIFNELMATDGYGRVLGALTKVFVTMQKTMGENLERYFSALSLPTHSDVVELGERLSRIESRLHSIEEDLAKLSSTGTRDLARGGAPRPPRTRKPASAKGSAS